MDTEDKIRKLMRLLEVRCPNCDTDCLVVDDENDTEVGIMDTVICSDCDNSFYVISSVHTHFVPINNN